MENTQFDEPSKKITTLDELAKRADYSLINSLNRDPLATATGEDYAPRQVFSGHYVNIKPSPITDSTYVAHSQTLFRELGFDDSLAHTDGFRRPFSGDIN